MRFKIAYSYNLDLLNFTNVLTGDEFYTRIHEDAFERFRASLSKDSLVRIKKPWRFMVAQCWALI